jgi:hypothetical protein
VRNEIEEKYSKKLQSYRTCEEEGERERERERERIEKNVRKKAQFHF